MKDQFKEFTKYSGYNRHMYRCIRLVLESFESTEISKQAEKIIDKTLQK